MIAMFTSCKNEQYKLEETSFSTKVMQAQIKYLDQMISTYSDVSNIGKAYSKENDFLDTETSKIKHLLSKGTSYPIRRKNELIKHFSGVCKNYGVKGFDILEDASSINITTPSDVDFFRLYVKNYMVAILSNDKLLPKDSWTTMASSDKWVINKGENFEVNLATIACNRQRKDEWFLIKNDSEPLTPSNIIDTLVRNDECQYTYKTSTYKMGENRLTFYNKIPYKDYILAKTITFFVK